MVLLQASRGTVKASGNFNASADAEVLHKAMKGLGTDEDAILQLLTARSNAQRQEIKATYKTLFGKGAGTDEKVLVEILASRTCGQVKDIIAGYRQEYDDDLEEDVSGDTSGHFKRLLVILLQASRQMGIQNGEIEKDAQALFKAGEEHFGTDEQTFVTILGNRSAEHLRKGVCVSVWRVCVCETEKVDVFIKR
ncbi:hypothetical protein INR49_016929 [Caranx melampygus]|nr:hypothetical protein INR49_016929 [Caranx melampygus]